MPTTRRRKSKAQEQAPLTADAVVARQVTTLRKRRLMTQEQLGERLGWSQSIVARLEAGQRAISVADLLALSWALDVAPGYLLAGSFQEHDVPVRETVQVPPHQMLKWIRGGEPLPGLDYRAYFENIPDSEWIERYGPIADQRAVAAFHYEQAEIALEKGLRGSGAERSPEEEAQAADERATRRKQLEASKRARRPRKSA